MAILLGHVDVTGPWLAGQPIVSCVHLAFHSDLVSDLATGQQALYWTLGDQATFVQNGCCIADLLNVV